MTALRHELISASAGSGKTYQLVRRYLHLLAVGADPTSVAAMTFTRKAAGEFFHRILAKAAELAEGKTDPQEYFAGLLPAPPAGTDYSAILGQIVRQMPRLRLGTLDSFFASMAGCFPLELGLPAGAGVMTEDEALQYRNQALERLLEQWHRAGESAQPLMEGIKLSSYGADEKRSEEALRQWVSTGHELWNSLVHPDRWGQLQAIWPDDPSWKQKAPTPDDLHALVQRIQESLGEDLHEGGRLWFEELADQVQLHEPGMTLQPRIKTFLEKSVESWEDLLSGHPEVKWNRKELAFTGDSIRAWIELARALLHLELQVCSLRSRGVATLMSAFEDQYHQLVRSRGRLSFADIPRLLKSLSPADHPASLWFRIDGRFEHWMFDEFQDTSFVQWDVMRGLVDEAIQDPEGRRSFLAVGDPKQSIYLWRQAEPELFRELLQRYPADGPGPGLHLETLSRSFRSSQSVLDAVNLAFGNRVKLQQLVGDSVEDWSFEDHVAHQSSLEGCTELWASQRGPRDPANGAEEGIRPTHALAAALIRKLRPLERGLTCAVLVKKNKVALELAEALRQLTPFQVVCESKQFPATDNALTLALLSLLRFAAHPGDAFSLGHLRLTPLAAQIEGEDRPAAATATEVQAQVLKRGFVAFIETWTQRLEQAGTQLDAFHRLRVNQLRDLAAAQDETGNRSIDDFLELAEKHPVRTRGAMHSIQVMTAHAAKGLEFDVVLLAELDRDGMTAPRSEEWLSHTDRGVTEWVLKSPNAAFIQLDEKLAAERHQAVRQAGFESMCGLYVSMTRAKRGLYLLLEKPPKSGKAVTQSKFLRDTLEADPKAEFEDIEGVPAQRQWMTGNPEWFQSHALREPPPPHEPSPVGEKLGALLRATQPRQRRRTPSGEESFSMPGRVYFSKERDAGRRLGTLVHEMFACIDWLDTRFDPSDLESDWEAVGWLGDDDPVSREARQLVERTLEDAEMAATFRRESADDEVWRERPFDFIEDGDWISGAFDRLVLDRSDPASPSARLVDFKTDEISSEKALLERVAGYRPQLELYRKAASLLTAIPEQRIRTELLFVRHGKHVVVHDGA